MHIAPVFELNCIELTDLGLEFNLPPSNYFILWNELAKWQMDVLIQNGLKPESCVLDVGCGGMRLGVSLVNYLQDNHYYGVDAYGVYIKFAHKLMSNLQFNKHYNIVHDENFRFDIFNVKFDFAMAQSVITHLSVKQIEQCLDELIKVMKKGGKFIFTFLIGKPLTQGFLYDGIHAMQRAHIENVKYFLELGRKRNINFTLLDVKHPTNQLVGLYEF